VIIIVQYLNFADVSSFSLKASIHLYFYSQLLRSISITSYVHTWNFPVNLLETSQIFFKSPSFIIAQNLNRHADKQLKLMRDELLKEKMYNSSTVKTKYYFPRNTLYIQIIHSKSEYFNSSRDVMVACHWTQGSRVQILTRTMCFQGRYNP
jgi:hypothetical protein